MRAGLPLENGLKRMMDQDRTGRPSGSSLPSTGAKPCLELSWTAKINHDTSFYLMTDPFAGQAISQSETARTARFVNRPAIDRETFSA
jgi:hypothetical protein